MKHTKTTSSQFCVTTLATLTAPRTDLNLPLTISQASLVTEYLSIVSEAQSNITRSLCKSCLKQ